LDPIELQKKLLERWGLRVEPEMSRYVARRLTRGLTQGAPEALAIIGGDSRTGRPIQMLIDPAELSSAPSLPGDRSRGDGSRGAS
jgi:hypothetical protein